MDAEVVTGIAAGTAGIMMGIAPLLQAARVHRRRHSDDVSAVWLVILAVGGAVWLVRGLVVGDAPIIIANVVVVISSLFTLGVVLHYRREALSPAAD